MASKYDWNDFDWENMKDDLDRIIALSRYYGSDPEFVLAGGGNTSAKTEESLFIKASGITLADIDRDGFVELNRYMVRDILKGPYSQNPIEREEQVKIRLLVTQKDKDSKLRPSVETMLHEAINFKFVVHTHPRLINGLTCSKGGKDIAGELFGDDALWIDYTDPGYTLAKRVYNALDRYRLNHDRKEPAILFIQNHGVFVSADNPQRIKELTDEIISKLSEYISAKDFEPAFGKQNPAFSDLTDGNGRLNELIPAIRAIIGSKDIAKLYPIVVYGNSDLISEFVSSERCAKIVQSGALTPDQIVYCRRMPLWVEQKSLDDSISDIADRMDKSVRKFISRFDHKPKIIVVQGLGVFAIADNKRNADIAIAVYEDALNVIKNSAAFGGTHFMNDRQARFIDEWEVESYRRKVGSHQQTQGRVAGKIAVVTGAAQGFGEGIAISLASEGASVVIVDINLEGAQATADSINAQYGSGTAMAIKADITNEESVSSMIAKVVREYGGIDIFISNAGVLRAGSVKTLALKDFEFVTKVNYIGYFVCVKHVAPVMSAQHKYDPSYLSDVIQINSKSGLQGSNKNSAYAGSKFGGIGLTQSFALELIEDGIKVNSICPGNFLDGPLWSDPEKGLFVQYLRAGKVPGAKTIEDVRKAYEEKVPMGRGCTVSDVMHAIYYIIDQPYETGQAIPVTGGQVMR